MARALLAFLLLDIYFNNQPRRSWLWLLIAGIVVGLAYLTRYAGLALLATLLVAVIILHDSWRQRIRAAAVVMAGFLPLMIAWGLFTGESRAVFRKALAVDDAT